MLLSDREYQMKPPLTRCSLTVRRCCAIRVCWMMVSSTDR